MRIMAAMVVAVLIAAGCGGGGSGPESVALDFTESALRSDYGSVWGTVHPALRAETTRAEFTACASADSDGASGEVDADVADTFTEGGITYVDVSLTAEGLFGEQAATITVGLLEHEDEGWRVVRALGGDGDDGCFPNSVEIVDELLADA